MLNNGCTEEEPTALIKLILAQPLKITAVSDSNASLESLATLSTFLIVCVNFRKTGIFGTF
ncbi:hypothetical protein MPTA7750_6560 [Mycoplasmoides pneumoniae]|nr:hypothetical protein OA631U_1180 [Mycoplasmoides pneumoniae]